MVNVFQITFKRPIYDPLLCSGLLTEIFHVVFAFSMRKMRQTQFTNREFIALILFGEYYKLQSITQLSPVSRHSLLCGRNTLHKHFVLEQN
jgi:hypothetical protein